MAPPSTAARMREFALAFPAQLAEGFRAAREVESRLPRTSRAATVVGMGGSAIAGDLLAGLTDLETELALTTHRGPRLPGFVGTRSIVLLVSYSGNTWETLSAYEEAGRRRALRIAVSSGGDLADRAERDGVSHLPLPGGIPPRAAIGFLLGGLLGLLDPWFPEANEARLARVTRRLSARQSALASSRGGPARLARRIGGRSPYVIGASDFAAVARRWASQFEENAKRLAQYDTIPELLHNALVAWDALSPEEARLRIALLLEPQLAHPGNRAATDFLLSVLRRRGVGVERVRFEADDPLEGMLSAVSFGDHTSLFLAEAGRVDPAEVQVIDRWKQSLARPGRPASARFYGARRSETGVLR
ncbi:MAG TPA: SIS domain-containing protein [Thermoplasmata archaeon]|nr:SIS domain-containing protein [Thermoplasmata archaeon]